jgi:2'-5' RNA ligase
MAAGSGTLRDVMPETLECYRLFIALPVPKPIRVAIGEAQAGLRKLLPKECARWASPDQFHLTLRFLGDVECAKLEALTAALQTACAESAPFGLRAEGLGFFPNAHSPRVIWIGLKEDTGALDRLWQEVQAASSAFTSQPVEHCFAGHVTIGRIKFLKPRDRATLMAQAECLATRRFGGWQADHVELMRSELTPQGARHTCLAALAFVLSKPPACQFPGL